MFCSFTLFTHSPYKEFSEKKNRSKDERFKILIFRHCHAAGISTLQNAGCRTSKGLFPPSLLIRAYSFLTVKKYNTVFRK